jgi:hypothetical protein
VSTLTNLSNKKIGNHTGDHPLLYFASFFSFVLPAFGCFSFSESLGDPC